MEENYPDHINLIISPHLDDAVFSLGGLIAKESQKTKIVTIFAGIPQKPLIREWDINCGFKNSTKAMEERIKENNLALISLGINEQNIINLPFLDIQYRQSFFTIPKYFKHKNFANGLIVFKNISEELKKIINSEKANIIKIFIPVAFFEGDHGIVRVAGLEAYNNTRNFNKKIELYLYQDMPYFYNVYLRKCKKESKKSKEQVLKEIKPEKISCENMAIELTEKEYIKKIKAIKLYKSQFKMILKDHDLLHLIKNQFFISKIQANSYNMITPYCEIVYKAL